MAQLNSNDMTTKLRSINTLNLHRMISEPWRYVGLIDGLNELPKPDLLTIGRKKLTIPETMDEFSDSITYGQRLYFARPEPNECGIVLRYIAGYYYTIVTKKPWDEKRALQFGAIILHSTVRELFPTALHFVNLMVAMVEREHKLLQRDPTKQERAAGIDKLSKFSDLTAIMFLMDTFKCSEHDVMLKPYNDCLVRFMLQHEQHAFADRLADVYKRESESKMKSK